VYKVNTRNTESSKNRGVGINVLGVIGTLDKYIEKKIITGE
jgi:hypothetical protein